MPINLKSAGGGGITLTPASTAVDLTHTVLGDGDSTGASLVGYMPAGTGAVATTVQEVLRDAVSVFRYMTSAQIADVKARTRSLDVTAAITTANTYAKSVNKRLYFPAGHYKYTPTEVVEAQSWVGESAENTSIYTDCAAYSGVVFRNTGGRWADLTIRETNLIKTSGILYQLSASTALSAIGGAASFTAYAKSDRLWVFGGQYALDIGNMFTCEFLHCRFNQAGTGANCTPLLAGGGYANTLHFIDCEIAENNKNCHFFPAGGPAVGVTFTNGSIERCLTTSSVFNNCPDIAFRDVYLEQVASISPITITSCGAAYAKFGLSGSNCDLTIGTNTSIKIDGWYSSVNRIIGADGTNSVMLENCLCPTSGNSPKVDWLNFYAEHTTYNNESFFNYEEGVWTPALSTTGVSLTSVTYDALCGGKFVRYGKLVHIQGFMRTDAVTVGAATGVVVVSGLPFTVASNAPGQQDGLSALPVAISDSWSTNNPCAARAAAGTNYMVLFYRTTANGNADALPVSSIATGADSNNITFGGTYVSA